MENVIQFLFHTWYGIIIVIAAIIYVYGLVVHLSFIFNPWLPKTKGEAVGEILFTIFWPIATGIAVFAECFLVSESYINS